MNRFKGLKRGFTLIELLVVIIIIGVLSSIVVASLTAGTKWRLRDQNNLARRTRSIMILIIIMEQLLSNDSCAATA